MLKNYFEKQGNKTEIFAEGQTILIDTHNLKRIQTRIKEIEINSNGFAVATMDNNGKIPLHAFITNAKRNEFVNLKGGKLDCRTKNLEIVEKR